MAEPTEVVETPEPETEAKGLRGQLETALDELKTYKTRDKVRAFADAGLDTTTGLGKAIAKEYEGDMTKDAVLEYASAEYGHVAGETQQHPQADAINTGQAALDQVGQTAGSVAPPNREDVLAKAEAEGDMATTMAIKSQKIAEMFQ